jgi:hypothetical protein
MIMKVSKNAIAFGSVLKIFIISDMQEWGTNYSMCRRDEKTCTILIRNPEGNRSLGGPGKWEGDFKIDVEWIFLVLGMYMCWSQEHGNEPSRFHESQGISWLSEGLLASQWWMLHEISRV